jgi:hypothetical protein
MRLIRSRRNLQIAATAVALCALLLLPACWTFSLEPLFDGPSDPDLIFDQNLVGAWGDIAEGCQWAPTVQANARAYDMTMSPGAGCKGDEKTERFLAYLGKLDNHRFLDVEPNGRDTCSLCLGVHTFALLSLDNDKLVVTPLDGDWLLQSIKDK